MSLSCSRGGVNGIVSGGLLVDPEVEDISIFVFWEIIFRLSRSFSPVEKLEKA